MEYEAYKKYMEDLQNKKELLKSIILHKRQINQKYRENFKKYCSELDKQYRNLKKDEENLRLELIEMI